MPNERLLALLLLRDWVRDGRLPEESAHWGQATPLTRELVLGGLRHKGSLDAIIRHLSQRPPSPDFAPVLWIGLLQILWLDGIAEHAAVHETLEAARSDNCPRAQIGYANGLLRNVIRKRGDIEAWLKAQPPHIRLSHPEMLFRRWKASYGEASAIAIMTWNQQRAVTWARRTPLAGDAPIPDDLTPHPQHPDFYQLPRGLSPTSLPGFDEGHWYLQDPSTVLAPTLLNPQPGERILDACAAPGGKAAWLAEALGDAGRGLTAMDPSSRRITRLCENLDRLKLDNVRVRQGDTDNLPPESFDAILLDVPCSNTGVLQRRPDARWRFNRKALNDVTALQTQILDAAAPRVSPGGRLVYSTCAIEPEETTQQIQTWLQTHPDWTLEAEILRLPGEQQSDGAYAARLRNAKPHA